eukprot:2909312-Pyramimonas_sp.AAC.1
MIGRSAFRTSEKVESLSLGIAANLLLWSSWSAHFSNGPKLAYDRAENRERLLARTMAFMSCWLTDCTHHFIGSQLGLVLASASLVKVGGLGAGGPRKARGGPGK